MLNWGKDKLDQRNVLMICLDGALMMVGPGVPQSHERKAKADVERKLHEAASGFPPPALSPFAIHLRSRLLINAQQLCDVRSVDGRASLALTVHIHLC